MSSGHSEQVVKNFFLMQIISYTPLCPKDILDPSLVSIYQDI